MRRLDMILMLVPILLMTACAAIPREATVVGCSVAPYVAPELATEIRAACAAQTVAQLVGSQ